MANETVFKRYAGNPIVTASAVPRANSIHNSAIVKRGEGDYAAVFRELRGYSGWVVLEAEQDPKKAPALPYARKGIAHLEAALAAAGLT